MKKCLPVLLLLSIAADLHAQITVTNATFPVAGDTLKMAYATNPELALSVFTPPGGGQTWDLSGLQPGVTKDIIFKPAHNGQEWAQYPGADLFAVLSPNTETYYNVTPTKFELQGYFGRVPYDIGYNHWFDYSPPLPERHAPLNFFDINQSPTGLLENFVPSDFPLWLITNLAAVTNNAQIDSIRYREATSRIDVVDGYGSVSIPGGTYDVLREKRTQYRERGIDGKIPPLGWLDLTNEAIQAGFSGLGVDTTVSYYFHNDVAKEPIAIVTLNKPQNAVTDVVFKNTAPIVNALNETDADHRIITILPNPVGNDAMVSFNNIVVPDTYQLVIFDAMGQKAIEMTASVSNGHTEHLDFSHLPAGAYFFCVYDAYQKLVHSENLVRN